MEKTLPASSERKRGFWGQFFLHLSIVILLLFVVFPLLLLIMKSFKTNTQEQMDPFAFPDPFTFENYSLAWLYIRNYFLNSLILTVSITALIVALASATAFAFTRYNFPAKEVLFMIMLSLMMIPGMLTIISQYALVNTFNIVDNYWGVILPSVAGSIPFSVFLLRTFFRGLSREFFEAAEIDGANNLHIFFVIVIPLSRAILATLVITTFIAQWNDYLWPLLVLQKEELKTIPIGLVSWSDSYNQMTGGWGPPFAGYVISSLPLIVVFSLASKQFIQGLTSGAFKM